MNVEEIWSEDCAWLALPETASGVVVSSRVRLARNLRGHVFPGWADVDDRLALWERVTPVIQKSLFMENGHLLEMSSISPLVARVLFERHIISREMIDRGQGCGVAWCNTGMQSIMINEEDHLRMQVLLPGARLHDAWQIASALDDELAGQLPFAFSGKYGYLTACPTNVGTGLRASAMLHLPALALNEDIGPIINGLGKIGLAVRGLWGEGTEAAGHMFQISNQITLGDAEEYILSQIQRIIGELVTHEQNARERLLENNEPLLKDRIHRARAILENAWLISSKEALNLLSAVRLGIEMGLIEGIKRSLIDLFQVLTQPAHLQMMTGSTLKPEMRDQARALLIKKQLNSRNKKQE